jgi:glycosyltransferase involved in cell wall biosynthesis
MIAQMTKLVKRMIEGDSLPVYIIFRNPPVLISYFEDFQKFREPILNSVAGGDVNFLFQFGWHRETRERAEEVARELAEVEKMRPGTRMIFLCNSENEVRLLSETGVRAEFCHQNAFLDERIYGIHHVKKKYDAIYVARITPFKRHHLASMISSLKLIGDYSMKEEGHFREIMRILPHATWKRKVFSSFISRNICEAHCGLCLSAEEGAMFVSAEYLLSGLPVVSTKNIGGRDAIFDDSYAFRAADSPESVLEGVKTMKEKAPPPEEIRRMTLAKFAPHRRKMVEILQEICDSSGVKRDIAAEWPNFFTHKFGLRCFNGPIVRMTRILKKKK